MRTLARTMITAALLLATNGARADDRGSDPAMRAFQDGAFAEALVGWTGQAAHGDGRAARYLGVLYDTGEGVAQDQATALSWYERAASLGDVTAMFNAAVCFDAGRGTPRDAAEAARWYARAARHRFGRAEYNLALMTRTGDGVRRDPSRAAALFRDAADDGIEAARAYLPERATAGGLHAAVSSSRDDDTLFAAAQHALLDRSPDAKAQAAALFARVAAGSGPAAAMARYDLAWCLGNGIGLPRDRLEAYRMFVRLAAETTDPALRDLAERAAAASGGPELTGMASHSGEAEKPAAPPAARPD